MQILTYIRLVEVGDALFGCHEACLLAQLNRVVWLRWKYSEVCGGISFVLLFVLVARDKEISVNS